MTFPPGLALILAIVAVAVLAFYFHHWFRTRHGGLMDRLKARVRPWLNRAVQVIIFATMVAWAVGYLTADEEDRKSLGRAMKSFFETQAPAGK